VVNSSLSLTQLTCAISCFCILTFPAQKFSQMLASTSLWMYETVLNYKSFYSSILVGDDGPPSFCVIHKSTFLVQSVLHGIGQFNNPMLYSVIDGHTIVEEQDLHLRMLHCVVIIYFWILLAVSSALDISSS
jgi:hypothetical protein